ncbi:MAG: pur operon repressor [Bacillota bacterium]
MTERKWRRSERIAGIVKVLVDQPSRLLSLAYFGDLFGAAKSTISEDLEAIDSSLRKFGLGKLQTFAGAAGGVRYVPRRSSQALIKLAEEIGARIGQPDRILPGGYLYLNDLIFDPYLAHQVGEALASLFAESGAEFVTTVETKGIPIALATARALDRPLVVIRRDSPVTEGPSLSINYVSGSTRRLQNMSLARRSLPAGARVLFVDDFMKAGGTAKGVCDLMAEFGATVVGTGVLIETAGPAQKLIDDYLSLLVLDEVNEAERQIAIRANPRLLTLGQ